MLGKNSLGSGIASVDMPLRHPLFHRTIKALFLDVFVAFVEKNPIEHNALKAVALIFGDR